jgi:hypothetical protein
MWRRDTVSCYYFYGYLQGFYTTVWVPYETALDMYVQRECENRHMKMTMWQGNVLKYKGKERTGTQEWRNVSSNIPSYKGNERMGSRCEAAYWVGLGPSQVFAPSGYLCLLPSFLSWSPVVCILSAVMDTVPSDSKSIAWTGWPDADAYWCKGTSIQSLTFPVPHYVYRYSLCSLYISNHICTTPTSSR